MSLQVWLPLTRDLKNQGLSNVTVTNNGAIFNSAGKLGGCYSFNTSNTYLTIDHTPLKKFMEVSIAFWVKIISWNTSYATVIDAKNSTGYSWYNEIFAVQRFSNNNVLCFNIADGSSSISGTVRTNTLELNTWYHIICTYEPGSCKVYQDGALVSTCTTSIVPNFNSIANCFIGNANGSGTYQFNGSLNDVRIYDHCLSPIEIKQLSQGLVLHYPLNHQGSGQENILLNTGDLTQWTTESGVTVVWDSTEQMYKLTDTHSGGSRWGIYQNFTVTPNTEYTLTIEGKRGEETTVVGIGTYEQTATWPPNAINFTTTKTKYTYTFTSGSNHTVGRIYLAIVGDITPSEGWFNHPKLEKGSVPTPWCPNSSDAFATTMGLNGTTEYDCSGFCNNGTRTGTFSWTSDAPKYQVSTVFNGTNNAIQTPDLTTLITDKNYTIACWFYKTAIGTRNYQTIYGGPSGFELEARNGSGTEPQLVAWNWGKPVAAYEFNKWNHFVFVHSDNDCKIYLNGEYISTGTAKASNPSGNYFIGAWNTATQQNFEGDISDFRIYATALSEKDIKSLYNNNAYIDENNRIYGEIR